MAQRVVIIRCPDCRFDLREQLSDLGAKCPECGRFTTYREFFPRVATVRLVKPISWLLSTSQLILIPVLLALLDALIGMVTPRPNMLLLLVPTVVLVNLGLAAFALPPVQRRQNPWAVVELAGVFLLLNLGLLILFGALVFAVVSAAFAR